MPRCLALKKDCRVIITCNLTNGLVNRLCAKIVDLQQSKIEIQVEKDDHLPHGLKGKIFCIEPMNFDVRDIVGDIQASRIQFQGVKRDPGSKK